MKVRIMPGQKAFHERALIRAGEVIDVDEPAAKRLIEGGVAMPVHAADDAAAKAEEERKAQEVADAKAEEERKAQEAADAKAEEEGEDTGDASEEMGEEEDDEDGEPGEEYAQDDMPPPGAESVKAQKRAGAKRK